MKIALVNPKFSYKGRDKFPIGLAYIAAVAKKFGKVKIIDENVGYEALKEIEKFSPDIVGITSTTPSFPRAKEIAMFSKNLGAKVIMGGVHVTFRPEEALSVCDIVIRGEGEITFEEILLGKDLKDIKGISFKNGKKIIHNPEREYIENLDDLPFPAYELFPLEKYEIMSIITSRGCFYNCAYCCATRFWGLKVRFHSVERVIKEFQKIEELGFKLVKIHDSTFTLNKKRVIEICKKLIEENIDIKWSCETRADHLDREVLEIMAKAGCNFICMGIDSADKNVLIKNKRFFDLDHAKKVFSWCKELGIKTRAYVVFGLEGETEESVKKTIKYLEEIKPDQIMLSLATAYPGTELEKGKTIEMDYSWVAKFEGHGKGAKLYLPSTLTKEEYKKLADYMWSEIKKLKKKIKNLK
ncbi:MAG TPA: radical SAM protein [Nanoarchaeota archaeon]|nr:radical SAM protein [Nanoarchaeota archaeon]